MVGRYGDAFFSDPASGMLLFLIAHFHRAALLSMSDELAVAMNRLTVGDTRSSRTFTHRYWFHEVSNQASA